MIAQKVLLSYTDTPSALLKRARSICNDIKIGSRLSTTTFPLWPSPFCHKVKPKLISYGNLYYLLVECCLRAQTNNFEVAMFLEKK